MRRLYATFLMFSVTMAQEVTDQALLEGPSEDFIDRGQDGSYKFGYKNLDAGSHYHAAAATRDNTVSGSYGSRDPASRRVVQTTYTAGGRGFRARGPNIARQMNLSQAKIPYQPPVPPNSPDYQPSYDGYHDPNDDPSYKFTLKTPTYARGESADSKGTVNGAYSYIDDVGKRHDVKYEAGSRTGFLVKTAFPDSEPYGGLFYRGPNKPGTPPRGHLSIVQGNDGAYQFTATGPDQKRVEVSDSVGRVRGSYTYVDDKGVQRTVQYIAGPNIGYKVVRKGSGPIYSSVYPFPTPDYLVPPLLPDNAPLPPVSTTTTTSSTTSNDLFGTPEEDEDDHKSFDNSNDFLRPSDEHSSKGSVYHSHSSPGRADHWNKPPHTTSKPLEQNPSAFFSGFNVNRPTQNSPSSSVPFDDIFETKSSNRDRGSGSEGNRDNSLTKRPQHTYSYPKPSKSFGEEPVRSYLGPDEHLYSGASGHFLRLPPGVVVRAHVQSLDILPYGSRIPPPEETLQKHLFEELNRDR